MKTTATDEAWLITHAGVQIKITPANGEVFSLAELQTHVGGYIEVAPLQGGRYMAMNEDGQALKLPVNAVASRLIGQTILGDVVTFDRSQLL